MVRKLAAILSFGLALTVAPAWASKKAGVTMQDTVRVRDKSLVLNGMGVREATIFKVDVYVAGLYLEKRSSKPEEILAADETKLLHMVFLREVERGDIVEAFRDGFAKNSSPKVMKALRDRIGPFLSWMPALERGDTLTLIYVPGSGTEVQIKGKRKGVIPGKDFGRALFAIWLGPNPPNTGLKRGLLSR